MPPTLSKRRGCRYWLNLRIVGVIGSLLIGYVAFVIFSAEMLIRPAHTSLGGLSPADAA